MTKTQTLFPVVVDDWFEGKNYGDDRFDVWADDFMEAVEMALQLYRDEWGGSKGFLTARFAG